MTRQPNPMFPHDLHWLPRPPALDRHPELALLAVLHIALETLVPALLASHPHLASPDPPPDRETLAAHRLIVSAGHFQRQLAIYCRRLAAHSNQAHSADQVVVQHDDF